MRLYIQNAGILETVQWFYFERYYQNKYAFSNCMLIIIKCVFYMIYVKHPLTHRPEDGQVDILTLASLCDSTCVPVGLSRLISLAIYNDAFPFSNQCIRVRLHNTTSGVAPVCTWNIMGKCLDKSVKLHRITLKSAVWWLGYTFRVHILRFLEESRYSG